MICKFGVNLHSWCVSLCKFDVDLHLKSVSLMQTYIKLTPHLFENLRKILDLFKKILILFKKYWSLVKQMVFIQQKSWFYWEKHCFLNVFCQKNVWSITFFHQQIFNHTLSGGNFPIQMWMNLMTGGPQVIAKQLD